MEKLGHKIEEEEKNKKIILYVESMDCEDETALIERKMKSLTMINRVLMIFFICFWLVASPARAIYSEEYSKTVEDNSFLIEEAYNQEDGVVQHISALQHSRNPGANWEYTFTQEWPLFSYKHQLSYDIPLKSLNVSTDRVSGIGDFSINYRYQLFYKKDWASVAPRLTFIFPTGDDKKGLGDGIAGYQVNIPISKRLSNSWVTHVNIGSTLLPGVEADNGQKDYLFNINFGASLIWLLTPRLNILMEWTSEIVSELDINGNKEQNWETFLSPGLRYSIPVGSLEIVPGFAMPILITKDTVKTEFFFYLSFEHPFM